MGVQSTNSNQVKSPTLVSVFLTHRLTPDRAHCSVFERLRISKITWKLSITVRTVWQRQTETERRHWSLAEVQNTMKWKRVNHVTYSHVIANKQQETRHVSLPQSETTQTSFSRSSASRVLNFFCTSLMMRNAVFRLDDGAEISPGSFELELRNRNVLHQQRHSLMSTQLCCHAASTWNIGL